MGAKQLALRHVSCKTWASGELVQRHLTKLALPLARLGCFLICKMLNLKAIFFTQAR
jgi:hypothetical protein